VFLTGAVTRNIRKLKKELDIRLFERKAQELYPA
jgi:DNA-binding transcriptional LysR family regulator